MKRILVLQFLIAFFQQLPAQNNFDFEEGLKGIDSIPLWSRKNGQAVLSSQYFLDDEVKHSGHYSLRMERKQPDTAHKFGIANTKIPVDFEGDELTLSCWLKTKGVTNRVQMNMQVLNEKGKLIGLLNYPYGFWKGDNEWTQFTTRYELPQDAHAIYLGFVFVGEGKAWADDFSVMVDGKSLSGVARNGRTIKKAFSDSVEFAAGSNLNFGNLDSKQVANLSLLGKVWGFLKYYHPAVANGGYNWDFELFRLLPAYSGVKNNDERNELLVKWIQGLGMVPPCTSCNENVLRDALRTPDLEWINDVSLTPALREALQNIKKNRHQGKQYYMDLYPSVGNPKIRNEDPYKQFAYPDAGYRLLSLFRYWNLIQYWFPDKHLIGEDWKGVLTEFIPKMLAVKDEKEYVLETQRLIARIHDTHANVWGGNKTLEKWRGKYFPPVSVSFVGDEPVVSGVYKDSLAMLSKIERGDVIRSVNGKTVKNIIKESLPNLPASNYPTQLRDLASLLLRSADSILPVTVVRNGKAIALQLQLFLPKTSAERYRYDFPYQKDSSFFFIKPRIGYINLGKIKAAQLDSVFAALKESDGLIIDNRQYPGEFTVFSLGSRLVAGPTPFVKFPTGSLAYPGMFTAYSPLSVGEKNKDYYKGKVIILVNEQTQSSAEYHTMAFRTATGATVMGSTTAGADGNVSGFYLPGNIYTMFSGIGVLYPDGGETQRIGIVPDVEVKRTVEGIRQGRDELVEKAIELIGTSTKGTKAF